jgi:hypothetical protein
MKQTQTDSMSLSFQHYRLKYEQRQEKLTWFKDSPNPLLNPRSLETVYISILARHKITMARHKLLPVSSLPTLSEVVRLYVPESYLTFVHWSYGPSVERVSDCE